MKNYQTQELDAPIPVPTSVNVAMADIATTMREGLLAMAVSAGLAVMASLMEESVTALCGPGLPPPTNASVSSRPRTAVCALLWQRRSA